MAAEFPGLPDGMKVDRRMGISGRWTRRPPRYGARRKALGRIETGEATSNCAGRRRIDALHHSGYVSLPYPHKGHGAQAGSGGVSDLPAVKYSGPGSTLCF